NNKGETKKSRIETDESFKNIPTKYFDFIADNTKYQPITLRPVLENEFYRFTLTNEKRNQRITVDTQINFWYKNKPLALPNLAIVEIKSTRDDLDRTIFNLLKESHVHPSSMSKYCIGMAMLQPELKQNLFKRKIHAVNKICYA
ncbi:MAG: VTC domain-containing protein, partial [Bacteroidales bacterium]|nr:VTC domain-containing protein [Bacteroidales bacterium]